MSLKTECQAALDAFKTIVKGNVSSGSFTLENIFEDAPSQGIVPPALVVFDEEPLDWHVEPAWRKVLWDLRLQLFVQRGVLESAIKQCRDMRADLLEVLASHLTLNGTCQTTFWKVPPKIVKMTYAGVDYLGVDGVLTIRLDDPFTYGS